MVPTGDVTGQAPAAGLARHDVRDVLRFAFRMSSPPNRCSATANRPRNCWASAASGTAVTAVPPARCGVSERDRDVDQMIEDL
jgi:hypothetical protein